MIQNNILLSSFWDAEFLNNLIMFIIKYYNIIIDYTNLDFFSLFLCSTLVIGSVAIIL
jgi:hypothetical protein